MGASHSRPTAAGSSHPPARRARSASGTRRQGPSSSFSTGTHVGTHGRASVIGVDVSRDGSRIATAGADGSARIYDALNGEELFAVRGRHCDRQRGCAVNRAAFSPDGTKIATTGADATVRIMAADTGRELGVLRGYNPAAPTFSAEWSADGERVVASGTKGWRVWDVESGRVLAHTGPRPGPGITAAWTPDGTKIVTDGAGPLVWDATTGRELGTVQTGAPVADVAFSRDGTRLAMTTVDETSSTRVWDWPREAELLKLADGALVGRLQPRRHAPRRCGQRADAVREGVGARRRPPARDRARAGHALAHRGGVPSVPPGPMPVKRRRTAVTSAVGVRFPRWSREHTWLPKRNVRQKRSKSPARTRSRRPVR